MKIKTSVLHTWLFGLLFFVAISMQLNAFLWIATGQGVYDLNEELSALARYYSIPRQILIVLLLVYAAYKGNFSVQVRRHLPSILVLLYWIASTTWSAYEDESRRSIVLLIMQFSVGAAMLIGVDRSEFIERLRLVSILFLFVNLAFSLAFPGLATETRIYAGALKGSLVGKNVFGHTLCYMFAFYVISLLAAPTRKIRPFDWFVIVGYLALLVLSRSATSLFACASAAIAYLVITRFMSLGRQNEGRLIGGLALVFLLGLTALNSHIFIELLAPILGRDATLTGRDLLWDFAYSFINQQPTFGFGFGGFWPFFSSNEGLLRQYGLWDVGQIHNGLIEAQISGGIVGLCLTVAYLVLLTWAVLKRLAADPRDPIAAFGFTMIYLTVVLNTTESDFPNPGRVAFTALVLTWGALRQFPVVRRSSVSLPDQVTYGRPQAAAAPRNARPTESKP